MIYLLNDLIKDDRVVISDLGFGNPGEETMGDMAIKNGYKNSLQRYI